MKKQKATRIIPARKDQREKGIDAFEEVILEDNTTIEFPIYSLDLISSSGCAKYARFVAENIFGAEYEPNDAWNLRYHHETIPITEPIKNLPRMFRRGLLVPGDLVGIEHPISLYKEGEDEMGEKREYTHIAVFLGRDIKRELRFGEQVTMDRMTSTLREIIERGDIPKEIIKPIDFW